MRMMDEVNMVKYGNGGCVDCCRVRVIRGITHREFCPVWTSNRSWRNRFQSCEAGAGARTARVPLPVPVFTKITRQLPGAPLPASRLSKMSPGQGSSSNPCRPRTRQEPPIEVATCVNKLRISYECLPLVKTRKIWKYKEFDVIRKNYENIRKIGHGLGNSECIKRFHLHAVWDMQNSKFWFTLLNRLVCKIRKSRKSGKFYWKYHGK